MLRIDVFLEDDSLGDTKIPENTKKDELNDSASLHETVTHPVSILNDLIIIK